jgi:hypothetical protein
MGAMACTLMVGLGVLGAVQDGPAEGHRDVTVKVFLADFEDVPHPTSYSREYFASLFFGLGEPRQTPEGRALSGSVREYFLNVSEGRIDIAGEVTDWARLPGRITRVPHWKPGMEPFGESWPVVVAETLRANGIVGEGAMERLRLADGRMPDLLVFLNTDFGIGGVNRGWDNLREVLGTMGLADLWDDAWPSLPSPFSSFSATQWRGAPPTGPDGCIDKVPAEGDLELFPLSIMMHEMGHQLAGWPDLYGGAYEPWGVFDLMGGPAASTHFPMTVSAYLRETSGWMRYTEVPRRSQGTVVLHPLETHKSALRFAEGPGAESIIAENRAYLSYPRDFGEPPVNHGQRLLLYRVDPAARRVMMYGDHPQPKITTMIRRPESYGEMWGEGAATEVTAESRPSSRNSLGELWWEFRDIHPGVGDEVLFDATCCATDLLESSCAAAWTNGAGEPIPAGAMGLAHGQAALRWVEAAGEGLARVLGLDTGAADLVTGWYVLPSPAPRRLYVRAALPAGATTAASVSVGAPGGEATEAVLRPDDGGAEHLLVAELPAGAEGIEVTARAVEGGAASVEIAEAWLVDLPSPAADLVGAGGASARLADGVTYGPHVVTLPLGGEAAEPISRECTASLPGGPATLHGMVGFVAGAPAGARARVAVRLVTADGEWPLVQNLVVEAAAGEAPANRPVTLETPTPAEAAGRDGRLVLEVVLEGEATGAVLAVPVLRIDRDGAVP